jgi:hypothetical protein
MRETHADLVLDRDDRSDTVAAFRADRVAMP